MFFQSVTVVLTRPEVLCFFLFNIHDTCKVKTQRNCLSGIYCPLLAASFCVITRSKITSLTALFIDLYLFLTENKIWSDKTDDVVNNKYIRTNMKNLQKQDEYILQSDERGEG
ncbi:hypothetical protein ATANTOWER_004767 [Ataeniobius toweri]|uniref:Uncharacterized protein n=1 Tax=Ataeniobius toweri TaxID=208326 RepID=A0ABU7C5G3_9TELE|nr:hypothetical protein [Ataeniobius toweri]